MKNKYSLKLAHAYKKNDNGTFMFIILAGAFNRAEGMGITVLNIGINMSWSKTGGEE